MKRITVNGKRYEAANELDLLWLVLRDLPKTV